MCARMCDVCVSYTEKLVVKVGFETTYEDEWLRWTLKILMDVSKSFAKSSDLVDGYITQSADRLYIVCWGWFLG